MYVTRDWAWWNDRLKLIPLVHNPPHKSNTHTYDRRVNNYPPFHSLIIFQQQITKKPQYPAALGGSMLSYCNYSDAFVVGIPVAFPKVSTPEFVLRHVQNPFDFFLRNPLEERRSEHLEPIFHPVGPL